MSLADLPREWDVLVVGGGITGAGIFRQSVHQGYRTLLVEQRDFAWGTSSRSSKLVHGGLRYLKEGAPRLVHDSVTERQRLLAEAPGLVEPLAFLIPDFKGKSPPGFVLRAGLAVYDAMSLNWQHQWLDREQMIMAAPHFRREGLLGGARFMDAQVDDARLVLRVLWEGEAQGGQALSYTRALLPRRENGMTVVTLVKDAERVEVAARVVINATGAWADEFQEKRPGRLRILRGSHLVFPAWRLPLSNALSFNHPRDRRPVFTIPWEGATICGTTDLDHADSLSHDPRIQPEETTYLLEALEYALPHLQLGASDILSTWSGVRPVISHGKNVDPSRETRDHGLWDEDGVITITGGKLTTFRLMAMKALRQAAPYLPPLSRPDMFRFDPHTLPGERRLSGRHGARVDSLLALGGQGIIPGTLTRWCELQWAARTEKVTHLEDLMLRRTRLGLLLSDGGQSHMPAIRELCQSELHWSDSRWEQEEKSYLKLWKASYTP